MDRSFRIRCKNAEVKLSPNNWGESSVDKKRNKSHASAVTNKNKADDALKQAQEFAKQKMQKDLCRKTSNCQKAEENLAG